MYTYNVRHVCTILYILYIYITDQISQLNGNSPKYQTIASGPGPLVDARRPQEMLFQAPKI